MSTFNERDVRRHYDLLQHKSELGLTQLKAMVGEDIIGLGLFDNEDDFVSECRRYNELGELYVGVNPRTVRLLDDYGGLKNRMRTLFIDVVEEGDIDFVTGLAIPADERPRLSDRARAFLDDASVLHGGVAFFPLDEPIEAPREKQTDIGSRVWEWAFGTRPDGSASLMQYMRVSGAALARRTWFRKRTKFEKFRPFILEGISAQIMGGAAD
jgi:hypothetical protein